MTDNKKADKFTIITRVLIFFIIITVIALLINVGIYFYHDYMLKTHPLGYSDLVERYAYEFEVDKYLIYAVIKTESGFNPEAESHLGARGLMQIMPDAFEDIKFRLGDSESVYDDMFNEEINIRYGSFFIAYHLDNYNNNIDNAVAAYHAGRTRVNGWLDNPEYSADGKTLDRIPIADTAHYVNKVNKAHETYTELYGGN